MPASRTPALHSRHAYLFTVAESCFILILIAVRVFLCGPGEPAAKASQLFKLRAWSMFLYSEDADIGISGSSVKVSGLSPAITAVQTRFPCGKHSTGACCVGYTAVLSGDCSGAAAAQMPAPACAICISTAVGNGKATPACCMCCCCKDARGAAFPLTFAYLMLFSLLSTRLTDGSC